MDGGMVEGRVPDRPVRLDLDGEAERSLTPYFPDERVEILANWLPARKDDKTAM